MPKQIHNALTPLEVKNAKLGSYVDGGGLRLLVKESGTRSWVYRYTLGGRSREIGLGTASGPGAISLSDARTKATQLRGAVKSGIDPLAKREADAEAAKATQAAEAISRVTFEAAAEDYIAAHEKAWRNPKHRAQWRSTLKAYAYPHFGDVPIAEVETAHVLTALQPIWNAKPETASRVRGRIECILDAARARGWRTGENPARWRGHIATMLPARNRLTRGHHAAMPYAEVPSFIEKLRGRQATSAMALEFAILTAARSGEVLGATWVEIDEANALWTIPAGRMKAGREHRVPLCGRALEILTTVKPLGIGFVFPGNERKRPLSNMALAMLLRRMGLEDITVHGFRSSFRDWCAEQTNFPHEVCEAALAHAEGNGVVAAYRRTDFMAKRRLLADAWAKFCQPSQASDGKVTAIRGTQR